VEKRILETKTPAMNMRFEQKSGVSILEQTDKKDVHKAAEAIKENTAEV